MAGEPAEDAVGGDAVELVVVPRASDLGDGFMVKRGCRRPAGAWSDHLSSSTRWDPPSSG